MSIEKITLIEKFDRIDNYYEPHIISELNGQHVKLAKIKGEFTWHSHAEQDELFLVVKGHFDMHLRDDIIRLSAGDLITIPRGVEHKPVAHQEAHILLFEPIGTVNTGELQNDFTKKNLKHIWSSDRRVRHFAWLIKKPPDLASGGNF